MYSQGNNQSVRNIAIIGGGHAGICSAIRLMRHARGYMNIYMIEKTGMGGIAYSAESADTHHHLNLQAGRISVLREDPKHFMRWAKEKRGLELHESSPVPRRLFGEYCQETLLSEASKCRYAKLNICQGDVTGLTESEGKVTLKTALRSGQDIILPKEFDYTVIATGHLEVKKPDALKEKGNEGNLIVDQYSPSANGMLEQAMKTAKPDDQIAILGSGLAALDPVVSIAEGRLEGCEDPAERKRIIAALPQFTLYSRHSKRHATYANDHKHQAFAVEKPSILHEPKITLSMLEEAFPALWAAAEKEMIMKDTMACLMNPPLLNERIMKAMEPYVIELCDKMSNKDVKDGLRKYGSLITANRIGVVPKIGKLIDELEAAGKVTFVEGELSQYKDDGTATIQNWKDGKPLDETRDIKPLLLVNSIGRNFDYANTTSKFWNKEGLDFKPHEKTGMGVEVDKWSRLMREDGKTSYKRVFCCGVMCIGDEIARHGRLGAFSQSQGPIKTRATQIGAFINREISNPIPQQPEYCHFLRDGNTGLINFLERLEEKPLSAQGKQAIQRIQKLFDEDRRRDLDRHLYAERHGENPADVLAKIEQDIMQFHAKLTEFAKEHNVPQQEIPILSYALHILLEDHLDKLTKACCDITQDPSTIVQSVAGRKV